MALTVLLLGAGFSACSKMDNEEPQTTEKKLVKMISESQSPIFKGTISRTMSYYNDGHLKEATHVASFQDKIVDSYTNKYVWNTNSINVTRTTNYNGDSYEEYKYTMSISDGLIRTITLDDYPTEYATFNYDASNRVISSGDAYSNLYNVWDNDKLMSIAQVYEDGEDITTFTYGKSSPVKGYMPLVPNEFATDILLVAHPELTGMKTCQIFESKTITLYSAPDEIAISHFEYELDKDGYISKITSVNEINGEVASKMVYTFTWE